LNIKEYISSGVLEAYVLGQCSASEKQEVELYALEYPEVQAELNSIRGALGEYALLEEKTPPAHLKEKIAAAVKKAVVEEPKKEVKVISLNGGKEVRAAQTNMFRWLSAAAIVLLLVCAGILYRTNAQLNRMEDEVAGLQVTNTELNRELQKQKDSYAQTEKTMQVMKEKMDVVTKPGIIPMELKGLQVSPDAKAMAYLDNNTKDVYLEINNLPKPPEGMQYQFWAIVKGKPVSAGMIDLCEQPDTCGIHKMTNIDAHAFAISLEKKGGSNDGPKGSIYAAFGI
jgi:anti-sigma-K factor RskA